MADKLGNSETLAERLQQQYRYDPVRAYRKLKNYRRRRRIRRVGVAAGILLVLGLGWGWFHQDSPGDPLLLTQTIQPGSKKAVLTLADGSVWHIGDSAMLISTAQNHIRITSFLYGLLRPLDGIKPYRLEGDVRLPEKGGLSMFNYWKPLLTDYFMEEIKSRGGVLINLASGEMKDLFDWKRVEEEVRVVTPDFQVWKGGQLKTVVIYAKMCRGEMVRYIIKNRIERPEDLRGFSWEGFAFDEKRSTDSHLLFTLG